MSALARAAAGDAAALARPSQPDRLGRWPGGRRGPGARQLSCSAIAWLLMAVLGAAVYGAAVLAYRAGEGASSRPPLWLLLAASALLALVLPAARQVAERFASRVVYGRRADAYELMSSFVARMAETLAVDDVLPRLAETAARSVHAPSGEVRLWLADGSEWRQSWAPHPGPAGGEELTVAVEHQGASVGEIGVARSSSGLSTNDRRVLADLAGPAGLALSTVRLTLELRRRVEELLALRATLEASRRRLVEARSAERADFAAAVAGRVQPHLAAARRHLDAGAAGLARSEVGEALSAVRVLVRGVFPALLASAGLERALRSFAEASPAELAVDVAGDPVSLRRLPAHEAALYACCVAPLSPATPGASAEDLAGVSPAAWTLRVEVAPQRAALSLSRAGAGGLGLDEPQLERLRDRVEALGGGVQLLGEGPSLHVELPLPEASSER